MVTRPLDEWLFEDVEIEFGIERADDLPVLAQWLQTPAAEAIPPTVESLRLSLLKNVETWNEDELKMMFLAPFLVWIDFNDPPHYRVFTQRYFSFQSETVEASGKIEWLVSTGKQTPKKPFFFLQEYKPEKTSGNDPLGQLLIAMVETQSLNPSPLKPLYGCYTIGRFWFFVVLEGKKYSVSRAYDATQTDDLSAMIALLHYVKGYIRSELGLV